MIPTEAELAWHRQARGSAAPPRYLGAILVCLADDVLPGVDPVELLVQWIVVDGSHVAQAVDGQDDVRALLLVDHHAIDRVLLTEQQERARSCTGSKNKWASKGCQQLWACLCLRMTTTIHNQAFI